MQSRRPLSAHWTNNTNTTIETLIIDTVALLLHGMVRGTGRDGTGEERRGGGGPFLQTVDEQQSQQRNSRRTANNEAGQSVSQSVSEQEVSKQVVDH